MASRPVRLPALIPVAVLLFAAACGGKDTTTGPTVGGLTVTVSGLPPATGATVSVTGPAGFAAAVDSFPTTLTGLAPGSYTVAGTPVTAGSTVYTPTPATQSVQVASGGTASAAVAYATMPGSLTLSVSGLPPGTSAAITITGPAGYSSLQTAGAALTGLAPGAYTVAASVVGTTTLYDPAPLSQVVQVVSNGAASAGVTYTARAVTSLNLVIHGFHITQSVQTYDRAVPLVGGRAGLLRVFVVANEANTDTPDVRARFYRAGVLLQTLTIPAPGASVPTDTVGSQAALSRTWNATLPATLLDPGLDIVLDVDPANVVAESSDADNSYPAGGSPLSLQVQTVAAFDLRFVPILRTADNTTGNVTAGNAAQFIDQTIRMHPLAAVDVDVRVPYTFTDAAQIQSNDGNGVWLRILSEVNTLQAAEGGTRSYYGVIAVPYGGGIAGYGYIPGRTAVGWDKLPSGSGVVAHELGHNFGRSHAPCGGVSSSDPNYPYAGGVTGQWGYDLVGGTLKAPTATDLMGYCGNTWISDYTYVGVMNRRGPATIQVGTVREPSLVIWGRIRDGAVILEPAFEAVTESRLPVGAGPNLLRGLTATGGEAFRLAFGGTPVADAPNNEEQFAFAVPLRMIRGSLAELRLDGRGMQAALRATGAAAAGRATGLRVDRTGTGATVRWNAAEYPLAVIRDGATGQIRSLARGGSVTLTGAPGALDVTVSDRVRSRTEQGR